MGLIPNKSLLAALAYVIGVAVVAATPVQKENDADVMDSKIFNGEVSNRSYPFFVSIMVKIKDDPDVAENYVFGCAGSLITPTKVLTSARCVQVLDSSYLSYQAWLRPNTTRAKPVQVVNITNPGVYHSYYDSTTNENDIGIFTLSKPATRRGGVELICISDLKHNDNVNVKLVGFGSKECGRNSDVLLSSYGRTSDAETCNNIANFSIETNTLCARLKTTNMSYAEQGIDDSGAPLFMEVGDEKFGQVGLVSYNSPTNGCPTREFPGVYTIPAAHKSFLKKYASNYRICGNRKM